jgi:hypothetical protein
MALMRIVFSDCDLKRFLLSDQHDEALAACKTCIDEAASKQSDLCLQSRDVSAHYGDRRKLVQRITAQLRIADKASQAG